MTLPGWIRSRWWALPVLVIATFALFWPVLGLSLLSDDHVAVWRTGVHGGAWRTGFFRPLADLTIRWGGLLHGPDAVGYRIFNVALHGINTWLVLLLGRQWLGPTRGPWAGWMAAVLFLVYPFHLESVVWIVGRESAMATTFALVALVVLGSAWSESRRVWASAGTFFLGALCYESALLLPVIVLPLVATRQPVTWPRFGRWALVWGLAVVVQVGLRMLLQGDLKDSYGGGFFAHDGLTYLFNIPKVLGRLFLPPTPEPGDQVARFAALLFVILMVVIVWARRARRSPGSMTPVEAVLWSLLVSSVLPVLGGVSTRTSESDRFLYLPSVFLALLLAFALTQFRNRHLRNIGFVVLVAASVQLTWKGLLDWKAASDRTVEVITGLPATPEEGRLLVQGLPDNIGGAFVFRNGFTEALLLAGRDTARIVVVPPDTLFLDRAAPVEVGPTDRVHDLGDRLP